MALRPTSHTKDAPVSFEAAVDELKRAWQARRIAISGRADGRGLSEPVPARTHLYIQDHRGEVCIGDLSLYRGASRFWSNLWVRTDECRRCWSAPPEQRAAGLTSSPPGLPPDDVVFAFVEDRRRAFRAEGKKAGREELLKAVMLRFGLQRKVALDIWNRAPHDRKGGRPKTAGSEGIGQRNPKK